MVKWSSGYAKTIKPCNHIAIFMSHTFSLEAIVLKRHNFAEADRFITVYSRQQGKVSALAKGVRKLTSRKRAALEPGNHVKLMLAKGHTTPIVTEAVIINSFAPAKGNLSRITQTYQLLEIIDHLTVEDESHPQVFYLLKNSLSALEQGGSKKTMLLENIRLILKELGFTHDKQFSETSLKDYIESLAEKKLRTKEYFTTDLSLG